MAWNFFYFCKELILYRSKRTHQPLESRPIAVFVFNIVRLWYTQMWYFDKRLTCACVPPRKGK